MTILKVDTKIQNLRMDLIKKINAIKMFEAHFDFNKIEWGMVMSGHNGHVGQLELTVREDYLEINICLDGIGKNDRDWAKETADGYIKEFLNGYLNEVEYYEENSWIFTYSIDFEKFDVDDFIIRFRAMEKIINQKDSKIIQHPRN